MLAIMGKSPLRWRVWGDFGAERSLRERALVQLDAVGLAAKADMPLQQTSYGEKRRVEIAMALAQAPRLLLLDEPFAGLSAEERATVHSLLASISRDITIVMIEHDMDVALALADRITLLHYGEVITDGTRQQVVNDPRTREIYLGH
jgi:branched-chain amino acid transport system ATP-binding protein